MKTPRVQQHLSARKGRIFSAFVRLLLLLALLLLAGFVYLRVVGVPPEILQEIIRRTNAAGIPVAVDGVRLTLQGWRAENLRYYSKHPDDLKPLFQADRVYIRRRRIVDVSGEEGIQLRVDVGRVAVNPSVEWGVDLPAGSPLRQLDHVSTSVAFFPDRIEIQNGRLRWKNLRFYLNGSILKPAQKALRPQKKSRRLLLNREQVLAIEKYLRVFDPNMTARAELDFEVRADDLTAGRFDFEVTADEFSVNGLRVNHAELAGGYAFPTVTLNAAEVQMGNELCRLAGTYQVQSRLIEGSLQNRIRSAALWQMLSEPYAELLDRIGVEPDGLPMLKLTFGPAALTNLQYTVNGSFGVEHLNCRGLEVEALKGRVSGDAQRQRFDFSELRAQVLSRPTSSAAYGSSMKGGVLEGAAFWDGSTASLGISANGALDPNLLVRPLQPLHIAPMIIRLFRFNDRPPNAQFNMTACVEDWSSLDLKIQATAHDLRFQGVPLSFASASVQYSNQVLRLDPIRVLQGTESSQGSALIDFGRDVATFDVVSALSPAEWEQLILGRQRIFGKHVLTSGNSTLQASGTFDWGTMQSTRFTARVSSDRLALPSLAETQHFSARVEGEGPRIAVEDAAFSLCGGEGTATFRMDWDPRVKAALPYEFESAVHGVDFQRFITYIKQGVPAKVSGKLSGELFAQADFMRPFFDAASGYGSVRVDKGQLRDLPLFSGLSQVIRKILPGFKVFTITNLQGTFKIADGALASEDAYFEGDLLSAKATGKYAPVHGFDALLEVQVFRDSGLAKVVRALTSPLMKLLKIKLEGSLEDPSWKLNNF